jgi:hypothetical protein
LRLVSQDFHACPYCPDGSACRRFVFWGQEAIGSLYVSQGWRRPNQV